MNKAKRNFMICLISSLFLVGTGFTNVEQHVENPDEITEVTEEVEVTETEETIEETSEEVTENGEQEEYDKESAFVTSVTTTTLSIPVTSVTTGEETRTITKKGKHGVDWVLYDDGELVLGSGELKARSENLGSPSNFSIYSNKVKKIKVEGPVNIQNGYNMFRNYNTLEIVEGAEHFTFNGENINLSGMFSLCGKLTLIDVSNWDTENVIDMSAMFQGCDSLTNLDVSKWNTKNVTDMSAMFQGCNSLTNLDVSKWNTKNVTNMYVMFHNCKSLTNLDVSEWNTENVTDMSFMYNGCNGLTNLDISEWNSKSVTTMTSMFGGCRSLTDLNVLGLDTDSVTNMRSMFSGCSSLNYLDVSGFNTENVTDMDCMFKGCSGLTNLDTSKWNTENVTNMFGMFSECHSLTNLNVSEWNTENVTNMYAMFSECNSLTHLDLSGFNTKNVTEMSFMFEKCSSLTYLDLSGFNTENVKKMYAMFSACHSLTHLDLSGFNTKNAKEMSYMFLSDNNLHTIKLNEKTRFIEKNSWLSAVLTSDAITGKWVGLTTGNIYSSSDEFMGQYDGSIPDTYQWEYLIDVHFDANGGEVSSTISNQRINQATNVTKVASPTKYGYTFVGWEWSDGELWDFDSMKPYEYAEKKGLSIHEMAGRTITFVAKWTPNQYPIKYNIDGGINAEANPNEYAFGTGVESFKEPTKIGYTFKGWHSDAEFKNEITSIPSTYAEPVTLYAKWEKDVEKVEPKTHSKPPIKDNETPTNLASKEPVFTGENTETFAVVQTGDSTNVSTLFILVGLSSLTALFIFFRRKKYSK
ncbi:LPXTG-motif cell wall-anchored protein/uncharacterized repeat protein (TIGR02543 family) [Breznakia blatticola]|uniref:LPXTG-motif cell wall-anchored protein/uncharacterized repeat protein (TIGR02543 family) n=1 Tax=Breznakia blatticola TaxID=1754012 RepID=A0A4R7ZA26_9FIRM|nr:BspA family leucine-rich repeat surface protein [Breznakia blatticola]TDW08418.1 LPXTG-motif cell wall-anchored protein/uncharacterized repeat protein (TIGR02543 family) [Breznakia blatticola]